MYRYMCTAVENASKDDFYSTVEVLKKIYPDCREDSSANFGNEVVGRVLIVSDDSGENRVCIRYEYETKKVSVMSERKIDFFKGKKVEEIRVMGVNSPSRLLCFLVSLGFLAVNIVAAIFGVFLYVNSAAHIFVVIAVLTALYTVTSVAIRSKYDITILGTSVMQIGGVKTIAASIIIGIIAVALNSWGGLAVFLVLIAYYGVTLVSLFLSWVIIMLMNYIILKMN
ncbi:MAG: hypothetical protein IJ035_02225 [Oscillospiraceae bacterium]|nr:hypothetical protein [Oscillospiraceae bacterium]